MTKVEVDLDQLPTDAWLPLIIHRMSNVVSEYLNYINEHDKYFDEAINIETLVAKGLLEVLDNAGHKIPEDKYRALLVLAGIAKLPVPAPADLTHTITTGCTGRTEVIRP